MGRVTIKQLYDIKKNYIEKYQPYHMRYWSEFDYDLLTDNILYHKKAGRGTNQTYNDIIIMCDTETSKHHHIDYINTNPEYDDIKAMVTSSKFKYNPDFKDVATKNDFKTVGITFKSSGYSIDSLYEELRELYTWLFPEVYNDIDAIENIYYYLIKYRPPEVETCVPNHIVAWTISLRAYHVNIVTLYGQKPDDFCQCIKMIQDSLKGHETYYYWHNMPYDYCFIRKFMFKEFGLPDKQLNIKPYQPINVAWNDYGIIFKDSLVLAQCKLEKWAENMNVEHKKVVGKWDYNKIRTQYDVFTRDELDYIECDTLAGVECIDELMTGLNKKIYAMPYTATGIPREQARKIGRQYGQREKFLSMVLSYEQYIQATRVFHGGYTHANRYFIDKLRKYVRCYDFSSSYPAVMLTEKYPMERFSEYDNCELDEILEQADEYAFMFKLIMVKPRLRDRHNPMPPLQFSKCSIEDTCCINPVVDNGRILSADYIEIFTNEIDGQLIFDAYECENDKYLCSKVYMSQKDYLPRWFTDYVYQLYSDKCTLKTGDPVLYNIAKAKLNSLYGMCVQRSIRETIVEDYVTGEYKEEIPINIETGQPYTERELYDKYVNNYNSFLPYQWGVWVTSYAMKNLFDLAKCCETFCYSDTDSIYGQTWDENKIKAYNETCLEKLLLNNYNPVEFEGKSYIPGVAEFDGDYSEFKTLGAKRYCCRYSDDSRNKSKSIGKLKLTVAGVPKNGVDALNDNIDNFTDGFIFYGTDTGKLTHHYINVNEIYTDDMGNLVGDSVDLTPCDYNLSMIDYVDIDDLFTEEIEVQIYE